MLSAFPISDAKRGYRRHECSSCYKERMKSYYRVDPDRYKDRMRTRYDRWGRDAYRRLRAELLDKCGRVCACCGEANPRFLTIDHVHSDGNVERKVIGTGYRGMLAILAKVRDGERERYQTLCYNCNMGRKDNGGICPHKEGSTTIPSGSTLQANGSGSAQPPEMG